MIPVCEPTLSSKEEEYLLEALRTGWISSAGPFIERFETEFAQKVGAKYGIGVCNGTVALHLALKAVGIQSGDEVILPSFTMIATANAIQYCGAQPIFIDADPHHWTLDTQQIEQKITSRTKAILSVSIYGHPSHYAELSQICKKHHLRWIEDAAEGHGALAFEKPLALEPHLTAYSFFANKIITTGEGGMVCTNDPDLRDRCRFLKNLAFPLSGPRNYIHTDIGFNYRMTNLQAAIGCAQMERFDELVAARRRNAEIYRNLLYKLEADIQFQKEAPWAKSVYWMFGVVIRDVAKHDRGLIMTRLKELGVDTRPFFYPMHLQPIYKTSDSLPISENLGTSGLYLPSSSHLKENDIQKISLAMIQAFDAR